MKNNRNLFTFLIFLFLIFFTVNANAALEVRGTDTLGNQLIYDTVLDITWYDYSTETMLWQDAVDWADNLVVTFGTNVYSDWRLPEALPVNGSFYVYDGPDDGSIDIGPNITSENAELSHLFNVTLGNSYVIDDDYYPGIHNQFPFNNLLDWYYWYETESGRFAPDEYGFFFLFYNGFQSSWDDPDMSNHAMAVLDGDVVFGDPVPIPSALLLLVSGILGLAGFSRKTQK